MSRGDLEKSHNEAGSEDHSKIKSRDLHLGQDDEVEDEDMEDDDDEEMESESSLKNRDEEFTLKKGQRKKKAKGKRGTILQYDSMRR